jgi:hypothetical protein
MEHQELLDMIKAAIMQLANDNSVPQRQIIRELKEIQACVDEALPAIDDETTERNEP